MNIELLNPEETKNIFKNWGTTSAICYDSHGNAQKIGEHCLSSGHFSGSRGDYIKFLITDVPRFVVDQAVRHEVGVFKNVQSFRYVDKSFNNNMCEVPEVLNNNQSLLNEYNDYIETAQRLYAKIQDYCRSIGKSNEEANEQARYVLPMSTKTAFIIGFTIEALIHFMNTRLCTRAEKPIRQMATQMKKIVIEQLPQLEPYLVPHCEYLLWCPEGKRGCGKYPTKENVRKALNT